MTVGNARALPLTLPFYEHVERTELKLVQLLELIVSIVTTVLVGDRFV